MLCTINAGGNGKVLYYSHNSSLISGEYINTLTGIHVDSPNLLRAEPGMEFTVKPSESYVNASFDYTVKFNPSRTLLSSFGSKILN